MVAAGYLSNYNDESAYQALKQPQRRMPELLDEIGLTDRAIIQNCTVPLLEGAARGPKSRPTVDAQNSVENSVEASSLAG